MILIVRFARKVTQSLRNSDALSRVNMNVYTTSVHITLILVYTFVSILNDDVAPSSFDDRFFRIATAFTFFTALLDIFMAYNVWFALDSE